MKQYVLVLLLLCIFKIGKANKIDNLRNEADVEKFIPSVDSNIRQNINRWPIVVLSKQELSAEIKGAVNVRNAATWFKVDLNDDGKTDLVAYTRYYGVLIVMDIGNDGYEVCRLKSFPRLPIIEVLKKNGHTFLLAAHIVDCSEDETLTKVHGPDTLIYQFGQFVEVNKKPANYNIASVTIFTGLCALGPCPSYKLVVEANKQARYVAGTEIPKQGVFTSQLTTEKTKQILDLINYLKVKDMKDRYQPGCILDGGGWQLVVTFADGSSKTIGDFNGGGTFGLEAVYALMDRLVNTQTWKQIK